MSLNAQHKKQIRFYVSTGAALFTALALFETLKYQSRIYSNKQKSELVSKSQPIIPGELKQVKPGNLVLVTGLIETLDKNPIKVTINKRNQQLALRLLYRQTVYSNQSFEKNKKDYHINLKDILKGSQFSFNNKITLTQNNHGVYIKNVDKIDFSSALDIFKWQTTKRDLTLFDNLTIFALSLLRGIATIGIQDKDVTFLRGIEVGTREVEAGIKIGASLTVLGTLGITTDGILFIQPSALFKERILFLEDLKNKYEELVSKRNIWLTAFVISAVYIGRRTYNYIKKNNIKMPWQKNNMKTNIEQITPLNN